MFGQPEDFLVMSWEDISPDGTITFYRLVFCAHDEQLHLKWNPKPDQE